MSQDSKQPSMLDAVIPVIFLMGMLFVSVLLYGDNSSYGPNQIVLTLSAGLAGLIAWKNGMRWSALQKGVTKGIHMAMGAILILFCVGMLIGSWMLSGTVPTMIAYGIQILSPDFFYPAACLVAAIVAVSIGSSWSTAGTVGIAFIGIATALGLDPAITAGAVISGAYMGDKMSPLSDTTNLAPAVTGADLFDHIKHMMWTTIPAFALSLILFFFIGLSADSGAVETEKISSTLAALENEFTLAWYMLIPMVVLLIMANRKIPALPTVVTGALVGAVFAVLFQGDAVAKMAGNASDMNSFMITIKGVWQVLFDGYQGSTGNEDVDKLISRGGMSSMNNTVWLIISAMAFGGMMEQAGLIQKLVGGLLSLVTSVRGLIASALGTAFFTNIVSSDQYMAIVMPGRMFKQEFDDRGLDTRNLSRAIEDAGTVTSVLIPWNTCGAYMAGVLGVATLDYLPYAFFNILSPIIALISAMLLFKVLFVKDSAADPAV